MGSEREKGGGRDIETEIKDFLKVAKKVEMEIEDFLRRDVRRVGKATKGEVPQNCLSRSDTVSTDEQLTWNLRQDRRMTRDDELGPKTGPCLLIWEHGH